MNIYGIEYVLKKENWDLIDEPNRQSKVYEKDSSRIYLDFKYLMVKVESGRLEGTWWNIKDIEFSGSSLMFFSESHVILFSVNTRDHEEEEKDDDIEAEG